MTPRAASPQVCSACLRLHLRLMRDERLRRRERLRTRVENLDPVTRLYCERLFDHLTLGLKEWPDGAAGKQLHPCPHPPRAWVAEELALADRLTIEEVFDLTD